MEEALSEDPGEAVDPPAEVLPEAAADAAADAPAEETPAAS